MRIAISAAIIQHHRLLVVKKKESWILPGGKPEPNESEIICLYRELNEELPGSELSDIVFYKSFGGITPHKKDMLQDKVYFAKIAGEYEPAAEISRADWIDSKVNYNFSDITSKIIKSLKNEGYLL